MSRLADRKNIKYGTGMRQQEQGQQQHVVDETVTSPNDHPTCSGSGNSHSDVVEGEAHVDVTVDDLVDDNDIHNNTKLLLWQGVALLTADCMGVGVLALPNDIQVLGFVVGISFLVANLPINYYAGNLLAVLALDIEEEQHGGKAGGTNNIHDRRAIEQIPTHDDEEEGHEDKEEKNKGDEPNYYGRSFRKEGNTDDFETTEESTGIQLTETSFTHVGQSLGGNGDNPASSSPTTLNRRTTSTSVTFHGNIDDTDTSEVDNGDINGNDGLLRQESANKSCLSSTIKNNEDHTSKNSNESNFHEDYYFDRNDGDNATTDLINMSRTVFSPQAVATYMVKTFYYTNLFLVLGDYILVMARSVSAVFADEICLPTAGLVASVLMFGLCQFRSMASLGRNVSLASLIALLIVIIQCLFHHRTSSSSSSSSGTAGDDNDTQVQEDDFEDEGIFGKMSSLAGIGFAVGSQKLFLNIRHELRHREESSKVLAGSLTCYGLAYVIVIILAGPDPPTFLFDSIPDGWSRRIAGLLLWFHVAVSYAINSQALCGSLDRFISSPTSESRRPGVISAIKPVHRWLVLTLIVTISSYLVANAIPFFKDLVGLVRSGASSFLLFLQFI